MKELKQSMSFCNFFFILKYNVAFIYYLDLNYDCVFAFCFCTNRYRYEDIITSYYEIYFRIITVDYSKMFCKKSYSNVRK